ncbi:hypothetical protein [Brevundimonas vancanneytii]|mgnify:CR=1 FL=1|uniref:hypothetical protein n=1 Tax=Brevundimonas vancanneytii TaxID=1325724 RepID=UPI0028E9DAB1|nr:hypothetical protein [Brevundimonas diminuta]
MTESVFLFIVPDKLSGEWRVALSQLAMNVGWTVEEVAHEISMQEISDNPKRIWLSENANDFVNAPIEQCWYTDQPGASVLELLRHYSPDEDESHVAGRASIFLAQRNTLRLRGARPLNIGTEQRLMSELPPILLVAGQYQEDTNYWNYFDNPAYETVTVPTQSLRLGQTRSDRGDAIFDLLGPNRQIIAGPYFYVPGGLWKVNLEFAISNIKSPIEFSALWPHEGDDTFDFRIREDGVYALELERELPEGSQIVLSISTTHSVLYGELEVLSLAVTRLA